MKKALALSFVALFCLGAQSCPEKDTDSTHDLENLDEARTKIDKNQDDIIGEAKTAAKKAPKIKSEADTIINRAKDTKVVAETLVGIKESLEKKNEECKLLAAENEKLQAEIKSGEQAWFLRMIILGALGIPASIAVIIWVKPTPGFIMLTASISSLVVGAVLREYMVYIAPIGGACVVGAVIYLVLHLRKERKDKAEEDNVRDDLERTLVATVSKVQHEGWNQDVHDDLTSSVPEHHREKIAKIMKDHKIRKASAPIALVTGASE